jgi:hypothetical protein
VQRITATAALSLGHLPAPERRRLWKVIVMRMVEEIRQDNWHCFETFHHINVCAMN